VNHNCAAHQCKTTLTRQVVQERRHTNFFENEVNHTVEPNDCFLNLAQLRSATDVQKFRSSGRFPGLSLAETIEQSIRNRERLEREAKQAEEAKESERQERAAGKQAKAAGKQPEKPRKQAKGKGRKSVQKSANQDGKKRKRDEVDQDYAEGDEELVYVPRPSRSRRVVED
jgi:hypothetical protein